jgi:hypothetical protein
MKLLVIHDMVEVAVDVVDNPITVMDVDVVDNPITVMDVVIATIRLYQSGNA